MRTYQSLEYLKSNSIHETDDLDCRTLLLGNVGREYALVKNNISSIIGIHKTFKSSKKRHFIS